MSKCERNPVGGKDVWSLSTGGTILMWAGNTLNIVHIPNLLRWSRRTKDRANYGPSNIRGGAGLNRKLTGYRRDTPRIGAEARLTPQ